MSEPTYEPEGPPMTQEEWQELTETLDAINDAVAEGWAADNNEEELLPGEFSEEFEPADVGELTPEEAEAQIRAAVEGMVHDAAAPYFEYVDAFEQQQQIAAATAEADAIVAQHSERLGVELDSRQAMLDVGGAYLKIVESLKADGLEPAAILAEMEKNGTVDMLFKWAAENQVPNRGDERSLTEKYFPSDAPVQSQTAGTGGNEFDLVARHMRAKETR